MNLEQLERDYQELQKLESFIQWKLDLKQEHKNKLLKAMYKDLMKIENKMLKESLK